MEAFHCTLPLGEQSQLLSYEQVQRLDVVLSELICVHSHRPGIPAIQMQLKDFIKTVLKNLHDAGIVVRDVRINGGTASYILSEHGSAVEFNDYDFIFDVNLSQWGHSGMHLVKQAALDALVGFMPPTEQAFVTKKLQLLPPSSRGKGTSSIGELFIQKLFRMPSSSSIHSSLPHCDRWSLIGLGCGKTIELKFVEKMRRSYEFTVDSFQIILDSYLTFCQVGGDNDVPITQYFYPTVKVDSAAGCFAEALHHLQHKLIFTRNPEEIHGGGLLKYCRLLVDGYLLSPQLDDMPYLERYMCSRFFIDYHDVPSQRARIESYLHSHFTDQQEVQIAYLWILHNVIYHSSACLMNQERYQTLHLVESLIHNIATSQSHRQQQQSYYPQHHPYHHHHHHYHQQQHYQVGQRHSLDSHSHSSSTTSQCYPDAAPPTPAVDQQWVGGDFVCLDDSSGHEWRLDEIFYGAQHFPPSISDYFHSLEVWPDTIGEIMVGYEASDTGTVAASCLDTHETNYYEAASYLPDTGIQQMPINIVN